MTIDDLRYFHTAEGYDLLREASALSGSNLAVLMQLRKKYAAENCRAALLLRDLRDHATAKFSRAKDMVFDREGLEQSSGEEIATYRAGRYQNFARVADVCCGIGGDAVALAKNAEVVAVDINLHRLAITRWNAQIYGVADHVQTVCADAGQWIPKADAIFFDPSRRKNGVRLFSLSDYAPPVQLDKLQTITSHIGIKVAPGLPEEDIPPDCEVEFISESRSCKEAVLWFGDLRTQTSRRATLLPGGHTLTFRSVAAVPVCPPGAYIAEPDNAVVRAHLIDQIASDLNAWKLAPDVAYLSADHALESPFVQSYPVVDILPFNLKKLQHYITHRHIGRLDIKKRHFPITPEVLHSRLKLKGDGWVVLFLTRINQHPTVIVCDPPK